jgi:predicted ATPase
MLNKLSFKNYKAFAEGQVKIKPITILLGANSVGKSSIMQLFLLLQQTALSEKNYKSALKLHGGFVSLGEGLNLIRKKDNTKILTIDLDFYDVRIFEELKEEYFTNFCQEFFYFATVMQKLYGKKHDSKKLTIFDRFKKLFNAEDDLDIRFMRMSSREISEKLDKATFYDLVNHTYDMISKVDPEDLPKELKNDFIYHRHMGYRMRGGGNYFNTLKDRKDEYLLTFDFLEGITKDIENGHFNIAYNIAINEKTLVLKKVTIHNEENELISVDFEQHASSNFKPHSITSKYIDKEKFSNKTFQSAKEIFSNPRTIFAFVNDFSDLERERENHSPFASTLHYLLTTFNNLSSDYFENDNINYVSPLRAHPKRYYFLDKAKINAYVDTLDGDAIAETLKENVQLKKQVNDWLEKFNLKVNVEHLEDIIHKLQVNQNSLNLDITDVGFGISQVLPVIIQGFLSHNNSLTLIEQPEIHLHPKMQADLADLFIDIVISKNQKQKNLKPSKYLFIETHSEYLLKRLRRRISDGTISADNVAIYLIDPDLNDEGAIIRELKVQERGHFDWPIDFYGGELLKDSTEFIKNQQKTI